MGGLPSWLPEANSAKWHNRRWWDPLGYLRVRTLARPGASREVNRVIRALEARRPSELGPERDALDSASAAFSRFRSGRDHPNADQLWDDALDALDRYLGLIQEEHLRAVKEAGRSGA